MDIESSHEIDITPDQLREIAIEMDKKTKHESFQAGQVIRYKFNSRFAFTFKPEKTLIVLREEGNEQN